jgi:hypothetical protein
MSGGHAECEKRISELEAEVLHLKRRLAVRAKREGAEPKTVVPDGYLARLHPQDRAFMERKMGVKKR